MTRPDVLYLSQQFDGVEVFSAEVVIGGMVWNVVVTSLEVKGELDCGPLSTQRVPELVIHRKLKSTKEM